jgi:hypothetical protein
MLALLQWSMLQERGTEVAVYKKEVQLTSQVVVTVVPSGLAMYRRLDERQAQNGAFHGIL